MDNKSDKHNLNPSKNNKITRRRFLSKIKKLAGGLTGFGLTAFLPFESSGSSSAEETLPPFVKSSNKGLKNPFTLGVASGDPVPDGVILWTRLAPDPLNGGGMPSEPAEVQWEMAEDESFSRIVKNGTSVADPQYAHSLHVEVDGLESDQWYYYRFKQGDEISQIGRTKTTPGPDDSVDQLNFAFASCQNYPSGYYTAYDHLVNEDIDLVFFLGDYIYEGGSQGTIGRGHKPQKQVVSLDEYRTRYAQYKRDPSLQAAHAAFPWIMTIDDHEIKDNWGGEGPPYDANEQFLARRAAAFQAYYEHMPLREISIPEDIDMQLYRRFKYGDLAEFNVLDTRQFRTDFACGDIGTLEKCNERDDPSRTILGHEQEKWLFNNLKKSSARWNVLPQQVMMAQWDRKRGFGTAFSMDKWDGYTATRKRLFDVIKENDIDNLIVLTGDSHKNWVNNLKEDFNDRSSQILGTEFMGTSISSGGNGSSMTKWGNQVMAENEHIKFFNGQRGYVLCKVTPDRWQTDFRTVPYVDKPGAKIRTKASFLVEHGTPGVIQYQ